MINREIVYNGLLSNNGRNRYVSKIIEELAELIVAISHYEQGRNSYMDVVEEISDSNIQIEKLIFLMSLDGNIGISDLITDKTNNTINKLSTYSNNK